MFSPIKNPIFRAISRRHFLEQGGAAVAALGARGAVVGLGSTIVSQPVSAASSDDAKWKQFSGSKLVFLSENTPPTFALKARLKPFYELTGIEVEILTDILPVVGQKLGVDFHSGTGSYQLGYIQDKPIGAAYADFFTDITAMLKDDTLPQLAEGYADSEFFDNYVDISARYYDRTRLIGLPYDSAVACTFYRQDHFELHSKDFEKEYGYRLEFTKDTTWKDLYDFCSFFKKLNEKDEKIPYGYAQHQGAFAWTTQLDIQRVMFSHGRWIDWKIDDKLGSKTPGPTNWGDASSVFMMQKYKEQFEVCHPDTMASDTFGVNSLYQLGKIAIQVQYGEFAASIEDPKTSVASGGKTAYVPCPKGEASWIKNGGPAVNGTNAGIAAIGINNSLPEKTKRAAYLFVIWATSTATQINLLKEAGGTPTRKAVLADPEVVKARKRPTTMPNALTFDAVYDYGVKDPNFVLGPKIPKINEYHQVIHSETQKCLTNKASPEETCQSIKKQLNQMNGV